MILLKVVHPLKLYRNTKFHGPTLSGASFASPQKFGHPPFWNDCSYSVKNYGVEVIFNGMTSPLNFIKLYQLVHKLVGGDRHADRMVI
jgi:hypothetical protein